MILKFTFENFKSFEKAEFSLHQLTTLIFRFDRQELVENFVKARLPITYDNAVYIIALNNSICYQIINIIPETVRRRMIIDK